MTEAQTTLILTDRITNDPMKKFLTLTMTPNDTLSGTLSAPPAKLDSNVVKPQNLTNLTEDSQQPPSHTSPTDIPKSLLAQVNSKKTQTRPANTQTTKTSISTLLQLPSNASFESPLSSTITQYTSRQINSTYTLRNPFVIYKE